MVNLDISYSLPFENPVMIFTLLMLIILIAPFLFTKLRIPQIIGLILAGLIIGPYGLNLIEREGSIELLGTVGLLYIMFLAGIEINLHDFKKRKNQSFVFGALSFVIPFTIGTLLSYYVFGYPLISSLLIGSIFSSHTLVTYPIISRFGISGNRAVNISIGGTILTDLLSLLILSVIASIAKDGSDYTLWLKMAIAVPVFALVVLYGIPWVTRWFFKLSSDRISQFIFVLTMLFLAGFLAQLAGIEPVIGAFLAGLAFNRLIPHTSGLMNRLEFMGNSLFIPVFLIGVGMLIDIKLLFSGLHALYVIVLTIGFAIFSKYLAALFTQKIYKFKAIERRIIFGLSNSRAAAALAAAIIGFNIIINLEGDSTPAKLLVEEVLNATILLILVTCGISSFIVEKAARELVTHEEVESADILPKLQERILVPVSNPDTVETLIEFASIIKSPKSSDPLFVLNVIDKEEDNKTLLRSKRLINKAKQTISAFNIHGETITRYDINTVLGILHTIKESQISDLVIGVFGKKSYLETFFGNINENIIKRTTISVFLSKLVQPFNTIAKIQVFIPPKAEYEPGFVKWLGKIFNIGLSSGKKLVFYAHPGTIKHIDFFLSNKKASINLEINEFTAWEGLTKLKQQFTTNDLLVIISARPTSVSHFPLLENLPVILSRNFVNNNFILIYPEQYDSFQNLTIRDLGGTLTGQIN